MGLATKNEGFGTRQVKAWALVGVVTLGHGEGHRSPQGLGANLARKGLKSVGSRHRSFSPEKRLVGSLEGPTS